MYWVHSAILSKFLTDQKIFKHFKKYAKLHQRLKYIWKKQESKVHAINKFSEKTDSLSVTECLFRDGMNHSCPWQGTQRVTTNQLRIVSFSLSFSHTYRSLSRNAFFEEKFKRWFPTLILKLMGSLSNTDITELRNADTVFYCRYQTHTPWTL